MLETRSDNLTSNYQFPVQTTWHRRFDKVYENEFGHVAIKPSGNSVLMAGDPVIKADASTNQFFQRMNEEFQGTAVSGYYFSQSVAEDSGWTKIKCGTSEFVDINDFTLQGYQRRDLRRALNNYTRCKVDFVELKPEALSEWKRPLEKLYRSWIRSKAGPRVGFLLGPPEPRNNDRVFVAINDDGEIKAFVILYPYQQGKSYYLDLMVRDPKCHKFTMDNLLLHVVETLKKESIQQLSLGLCAFNNVVPEEHWLSGLMWIKSKTDLLYNNGGVFQYKKKFSTRSVDRYILMSPNQSQWRQFYHLCKGTYGN